jgi:hypothetical protein
VAVRMHLRTATAALGLWGGVARRRRRCRWAARALAARRGSRRVSCAWDAWAYLATVSAGGSVADVASAGMDGPACLGKPDRKPAADGAPPPLESSRGKAPPLLEQGSFTVDADGVESVVTQDSRAVGAAVGSGRTAAEAAVADSPTRNDGSSEQRGRPSDPSLTSAAPSAASPPPPVPPPWLTGGARFGPTVEGFRAARREALDRAVDRLVGRRRAATCLAAWGRRAEGRRWCVGGDGAEIRAAIPLVLSLLRSPSCALMLRANPLMATLQFFSASPP